jgi:hypothetical protein
MHPFSRVLGALAISGALAGCASGPPLTPLPPAAVPDLRGTWSGTWGGAPCTLVVIEQHDDAGRQGVWVGTVQLLGEATPGLTGLLTSVINGWPASTNARGWVGASEGRVLVLVRAEPSDGIQTLTLAVRGERLEGSGESSFRWGPRGPIALTRQGPPPAR